MDTIAVDGTVLRRILLRKLRGYSLMVKFLPSKQAMRVRFSLPAPFRRSVRIPGNRINKGSAGVLLRSASCRMPNFCRKFVTGIPSVLS